MDEFQIYDHELSTAEIATLYDPDSVAADISASPTIGDAPLEAIFDASGSYAGNGVQSYSWDFGDSNTASGVLATNVYLADGSYTATLIVEDTLNVTATATVAIVVDTFVMPENVVVTTNQWADVDTPTVSSFDLAQTAYLSSSATGGDAVATRHAEMFNGIIGTSTDGTTQPGLVRMSPANTLTVEFDTSSAPLGYDITEITSIFGWNTQAGGRANQGYTILLTYMDDSVEKWAGPKHWHPNNPATYWTGVTFREASGGVMASGVKAVTIDIKFEAIPTGWVVGREVDIFGVATTAITEMEVDGAQEEVIITWEGGKPGELYQVSEASELGGAYDPAWTVIPSLSNVVVETYSGTTVTTAVGSVVNYYRVERLPTPPIHFEDFEMGTGGYSSIIISGVTDWQLGAPNYTAIRPGTPPTTNVFANAYSGVNAFATGLNAAYALGDNVVLRTPVIDLAGVAGAVLTFFELRDFETDFDYGYVNILDSSGSPLSNNVSEVTGTSTQWLQRQVSLNDFTNQQIIIEFELWEDGVQFEDWFGWAIDDVRVEETPAPPPPPPPFTNAVTTLVLVDSSGTNNPPPDLTTITEGITLDLDALGVANSNVNIRAEVEGVVGSVTFALSGATIDNGTESVAPYYQFGDTGGNPADGTLNAGAHTIVATPWEAAGGGGQAGTNLTVNFTVTFTP